MRGDAVRGDAGLGGGGRGDPEQFEAVGAAAALEAFAASGTLYKELVAGFAGTIGVVIARGAAEIAVSQHIFGDAFPHALVEDKVPAFEFIGQALLLDLTGIINDTAK